MHRVVRPVQWEEVALKQKKTKTAQFYQTRADFQSQIVETYDRNITSSHVDDTNRSFMLAHWARLASFRDSDDSD